MKFFSLMTVHIAHCFLPYCQLTNKMKTIELVYMCTYFKIYPDDTCI